MLYFRHTICYTAVCGARSWLASVRRDSEPAELAEGSRSTMLARSTGAWGKRCECGRPPRPSWPAAMFHSEGQQSASVTLVLSSLRERRHMHTLTLTYVLGHTHTHTREHTHHLHGLPFVSFCPAVRLTQPGWHLQRSTSKLRTQWWRCMSFY